MSYSTAMGLSWRGGIEMVLVQIVALSLLATILATRVEAHEAVRVVQKDGIWWFQDSSGRQFFSVGVNCIGGCYGHAEETPLNPSRISSMTTSHTCTRCCQVRPASTACTFMMI